MLEFPHKAPKGYSYEFEEHNTRLTAIWLHHFKCYDYNLGKPIKTIWGFYSFKKKQYFSPINSKTPGKVINISQTTPYTAMQLKQTPLEKAFV